MFGRGALVRRSCLRGKARGNGMKLKEKIEWIKFPWSKAYSGDELEMLNKDCSPLAVFQLELLRRQAFEKTWDFDEFEIADI